MVNSTKEDEYAINSDPGLECMSHETNLSNTKQIDGSNLSELMDSDKINLVGGHINQIQIESKDVIRKKTSHNEVIQY